MPGKFPVVSSLDLTILARELAAFLRTPTGRPFCSDVVIVDGKGTSNWLTHALVREGGMKVQLNAQLLNSRRVGGWLASVIGSDAAARAKGEASQPIGYNSPDSLSGLPTVIYDILIDDRNLSGALAEWGKFRGEPKIDGGVVLWELSRRISAHFRELVRNDPLWITRVRNGAVSPDRWSVLWSLADAKLRQVQADRLHIAPEDFMLHEVDVLRRLERDPDARAAVSAALPGRIALFSTGDVSTTLVNILMQLYGDVEVRLFHLEPSRDFLEHIDGQRSPGAAFLASTKKYFELQQDKLIDLLDKGDDKADEEGPGCVPSLVGRPRVSLLESLKYSIDQFEQADFSHGKFDPSADGSVSLHRCHGVWREAEVLRDQLLKAFADDPELKQGDVLILSPDPEAFAPALEAVLGQRAIRPPGKDGEIRGFGFSTAGMYGIRRSPVGAMVDGLLQLPRGRLTALDVLNFLSLEAVRSHHGWDESQMEEVEKWFRDAPYNWGLDMGHRTAVVRLGLSAEQTDADPAMKDLGTLSDFLYRLSLGTAFGEEIPDKPIAGQMPLRRVDGQQDMQLAAEVIRILELLQAWVAFAIRGEPKAAATLTLTTREMVLDKASATAPYSEWHGNLGWLPAFRRVFNALRPQGPEYALECRALFKSLSGLSRRFSDGGAEDRRVSYQLFISLMEEHCSFETNAGQFMSGNVTLAPLRSTSIHPAKIIALMGMNDGAFPRRSGGLGPEIYGGKEKVHARRAQECMEETSMHAFLLAVLAAQKRLMVTFDGYLGADGAAANAAYPVEMLRRSLRGLTRNSFAVTGHSIMSYLPVALAKGDVPSPWTFDEAAVSVSKVLGSAVFPVLAPKAIPEPEKMTLAEWARFWDSPPREVLRRLGVRVPYQGKVLRVEEPLQVDAPTERQAADWVKSLTGQRRRKDPQAPIMINDVSPLAKLSGMFPPGDQGTDLLKFLLRQENLGEAKVIKEIEEFVQTITGEDKVALEEISDFSLPKRRVYIHAATGTMAVGVFERLYPDSEVLKWLCVLPRLAKERGIVLSKLFICGLGKLKKAEGKITLAEGDEVPLEVKLCLLDAVDLPKALKHLEGLVRSAASEDAPTMPRTMWAGLSEVMEKAAKGKSIRSRATSADLLGGDEFSRADADDQRARVFIPEKFEFERFNASIDVLLGADTGAMTSWTYLSANPIKAYLKAFVEERKQRAKEMKEMEKKQRQADALLAKEAKQALALKEAEAKAAQKAETAAQKKREPKAVNPPKPPKGAADQADLNS